MPKDYSLVGENAVRAVDEGLADGAWFMPPIDPDRLTALQRRSNGRALAELLLWLGAVVGLAILAVGLWPSLWSVPVLVLYAGLYGGAADARWHEMGHNTAFRTPWLNDAVYYLSSFMMWREPTLWRWSHDRHHTDTIVAGRDLEIAFKRPTTRSDLLKTFAGFGGFALLKRIWLHAGGGRDPEAAEFIPEQEWAKVRREAQLFVMILVLVCALCLAVRSALPLLLVGLPSVYGLWMGVFFGVTQHAGLQENVLDHRLNTRTIYMNPVFRFLYLNMNYHIEHHMFPTVPYYNLPALHEEIKHYLPTPLPNTLAAYRELLGAIGQQRVDESFELDRPVPAVPEAARRQISIAGNGPVVTVEGDRVHISTVGLDVGRARRVDVGDRSFALFRLGPQDYVLTDGFCTHGQAHLAEGAVIDCAVVECPKHNGRFDIRSGDPLRRPVNVPLAIHSVEVARDHRSVSFALAQR